MLLISYFFWASLKFYYDFFISVLGRNTFKKFIPAVGQTRSCYKLVTPEESTDWGPVVDEAATSIFWTEMIRG